MIEVYTKDQITCIEGTLEATGRTVFCYIADGLLIDTGAENLQTDLAAIYKQADFDQVVLTHSHEDHTGTAAWIEEHMQVPIYIHPDSVEFCASPGNYPLYRQQTWGQRKAFHAQPLGDVVWSRSQEWRVIPTPGHAADHIALFNEETGVLFSGDLFVSSKTKVCMKSESIPVIMASLRLLLTLNITSLFCSHAGYFQNGREMLEQKLQNLEALSDQVTKLHRQGHSLKEIQKQLFPVDYPIIAFSSGEWDSLYVVESILNEQTAAL